MQSRKVAFAGVLAGLTIIGLGTAVSANVIDTATTTADVASTGSDLAPTGGDMKWHWIKEDGTLFAADNNNIGPFQACHNNGAGNVIGGAAAGSDIIGILGVDNDGNEATVVKTCEQDSEQANGSKGNGKWYKAEGGIVSVSNNNVGPFQACHNNVSINGFGGAGTVSDVYAILGFDNDKNSSEVLKTCEQESAQHN